MDKKEIILSFRLLSELYSLLFDNSICLLSGRNCICFRLLSELYSLLSKTTVNGKQANVLVSVSSRSYILSYSFNSSFILIAGISSFRLLSELYSLLCAAIAFKSFGSITRYSFRLLSELYSLLSKTQKII